MDNRATNQSRPTMTDVFQFQLSKSATLRKAIEHINGLERENTALKTEVERLTAILRNNKMEVRNLYNMWGRLIITASGVVCSSNVFCTSTPPVPTSTPATVVTKSQSQSLHIIHAVSRLFSEYSELWKLLACWLYL